MRSRLVGVYPIISRGFISFRWLFGISEASTDSMESYIPLQGAVTYPTVSGKAGKSSTQTEWKGRDISSSQQGKLLTLKDYPEKSIFSLFFVCSAGLPANTDGESLCINECFCMFVSALNPPFFARIFRRFV